MLLALGACATPSDAPESPGSEEPDPTYAADTGEVSELVAQFEFATIPAQTFTMGCTAAQEPYCGDDEQPAHAVALTRDFRIGVYEVTQAQFAALTGSWPSWFPACVDCPVEMVSWDDAAFAADALSAAAGLDLCYGDSGAGITDPYSCEGYRLPTEAEWEAAARCGTDRVYAGSDQVEEVAWTASTSDRRTQPVGGLQPNDCGLYDMSGNVWEWTNEGYGDYPAEAAEDPAETGFGMVFRGGGYSGTASDTRVSKRMDKSGWYRTSNLGFRFARSVP